MDLIEEARQLVQGLKGSLSVSAYDVAWLARVPVDCGEEPRWPEAVRWLLANQWPDGSWGGTIPYYHDRTLCTLAAIIALQERAHGQAAEMAIKQGLQYIWRNLHFLHHDPIELVGFELILPTLLTQARSLGLDVPAHSYGYRHLRAQKLKLLPAEMIYAPGTSVAFSIEFLEAQGDPEGLQRLQGKNGAIANSPAATAYLALRGGGNHKAMSYLTRSLPQPPAFFPWRTFEIVWTLEHLIFGGLPLNRVVGPSIWRELQSALDFGDVGVGIDPSFGINDGDTTSVTLHVLAQGGQSVDPAILQHFESPKTGIFYTFSFERNPSVATNAHALEALTLMPEYPNRERVLDRIVATLLEAQRQGSYWVDKWHASPYYATAHVLIALIRGQLPLLGECRNAIEWFIHTQRPDGSWGFFDWGTIEETAFTLLALLHYHHRVKPVKGDVLRRGATYLYRCLAQESYAFPELWIAKSLYAPESIVKAAVLAAAALYQDIFGRAPD